ncbi:hypothetical protein KIPE111705_46455 [Kibdelosporangium persicum]
MTTWRPNSAGSGTCRPRHRRPRRRSRGPRTSRSRSSGWRAVSPAGWTHRRACGSWCPGVVTLCPGHPRIAAGGFPVSREGSSPARPTSTRASSASHRVRPWRWTRSSACCWRLRGKPSSARASTRSPCVAAGPVSSWVSRATTTPPRCAKRPKGTAVSWSRATPRAWRAAGCPTCSASKDRRSQWTRRARHRWWRCTSPSSRCAPASARWPSPVVPPWSPHPSCSSSSPGRAVSPPTAGARRSLKRPTAPHGARARECCWCSGCPTPEVKDARSSPSSGVPRSTRMARPTA